MKTKFIFVCLQIVLFAAAQNVLAQPWQYLMDDNQNGDCPDGSCGKGNHCILNQKICDADNAPVCPGTSSSQGTFCCTASGGGYRICNICVMEGDGYYIRVHSCKNTLPNAADPGSEPLSPSDGF